MSKINTIDKFESIFRACPWLTSSKNIVHFPITDPADPKGIKTLAGVSWAELKELLDHE